MSSSGEQTPTLKAAIAHLWSMQTQMMVENMDGLTPQELWDRTPQNIKAMRLDAMRAALEAASPSTPRLGEPTAWREAIEAVVRWADSDGGAWSEYAPHPALDVGETLRAALALASPTSGENGGLHRAADAAHKAMDYALSYAFILDPEEWDDFRRKSDALLAALSASPAGGDSSRDHDQSTTDQTGRDPSEHQTRS